MTSPGGDLFGMSQKVGMGWSPSEVCGKLFLTLNTQGGLRSAIIPGIDPVTPLEKTSA